MIFSDSKIFKTTIFIAKIKGPTNICKISCINKDVELINVPICFHDL